MTLHYFSAQSYLLYLQDKRNLQINGTNILTLQTFFNNLLISYIA